MRIKKLVYIALLTAVALIIFIVEAQLPGLVPIPGVKAGLSNIVTVYSMFVLGPGPTFAVLICRILLGCIFSGRISMLLFSLGGGLLCYFSMLIMRRFVTEKQIWVCSAIGAVFHNIGQIIVAVFVTGTPAIIAYLPILLISGIFTGLFTGICAQLLVNRLGNRFLKL